MSEACSGGSDRQATRRNVGAFWATDGLALAASMYLLMSAFHARPWLMLIRGTPAG
jgi:hypothetical protein